MEGILEGLEYHSSIYRRLCEMAIKDIYNNINGWLDNNMDWGNPNPY
jgi:hypothetical protein